MKNMDKEIEHIEQGNAWEESDQVVRLEAKRPLDKVIPIRLQSDHWEQLRKQAQELGVGPTTLARIWILERLRSSINQDTLLDATHRIWQEHLFSPITSREMKVLEEIGQGHSNKQIAQKLGLSEKNIETCIANTVSKLHKEADWANPYLLYKMYLDKRLNKVREELGTQNNETPAKETTVER